MTMMNRLKSWSLFCLLLSLNYAESLNFSNLLYSLKLCSRPGSFCPEPDCADGSTNHLCQWYDCTSTSSRRNLKSSSSSCTFFGSQSSCGNDSKCLETCSKLNDGSCPVCISNYEKEQCQDTVVYTAALQSNSANSKTGANFSMSTNVPLSHGLLVFLLGMGALVAVLYRQFKQLPVEENLTSANEGLIKGRINSVEAGNASDFTTSETRTKFRPTKFSMALA